MKSERFEREMRYQTMLSISRSMLGRGLISDEDFTKIAKVKETIYDEVSSTGTINVEEIAKKTFENNANLPERKKYLRCRINQTVAKCHISEINCSLH